MLHKIFTKEEFEQFIKNISDDDLNKIFKYCNLEEIEGEKPMRKLVTVPEMIEAIKEHYNLNDTLLAINLKVTNQTIKAWKEGKKPRKDSYLALTELYNGINLEEQTEEVTEVTEKKPYEISYPNDETEVYFISDLTGKTEVKEYNVLYNGDKKLYDIGLLFDIEEEAEQFKRERALIKKIKCWAKEQQGDWKPDWSDDTLKYDIYCYYGIEKKLEISDVYYVNDIKKLPYFKSQEIAQACIDEFGDEILEVFC